MQSVFKKIKNHLVEISAMSGRINTLLYGLTYNGADILLFARIFPLPFRARKNTTQLAKYSRVLYVKPFIHSTKQKYIKNKKFHRVVFKIIISLKS